MLATISIGSTNKAAVEEAQYYLMSYGYLPASALLGTFGPAMQDAVRAFQRNNGLGVDGIVGPNTWTALKARNPVKADGTRYMPDGTSTPGPAVSIDFSNEPTVITSGGGAKAWWMKLTPAKKAVVASVGAGLGLMLFGYISNERK